MAEIKIPSLSFVKDIIYIAGIAVAVIFFFIDKAKSDAVQKEQLRQIIEKMDNSDEMWKNQKELNDKLLIISYIVLDSK